MHPDEETTVRRFFARDRRAQFLRRMADPSTRSGMLGQLYHFHDFEPGTAHRVPPSCQNAGSIYSMLRERGAPRVCRIISASEDLDGKASELETTLERVVGFEPGTIVSCLPGKLAYFEGEAPGERFILQRDLGQFRS